MEKSIRFRGCARNPYRAAPVTFYLLLAVELLFVTI
jgi:hypothetical protein